MFSIFKASPRGAFLAELPLTGNCGGLLCHEVAVMRGAAHFWFSEYSERNFRKSRGAAFFA